MDQNQNMNPKMDKKEMNEVMEHLDGHITYPATKQEIIKACENMSDVPADDKNWVMKNLPDKTYMNTDDVKNAMRMAM